MIRTIMIFPQFDNMELIDHIRDNYDPLASLVKPHITIVFPFELEISNAELIDILNSRLIQISPFKLELQGFCKSEDAFGNYLFLKVIKGQDMIKQMHDILYENEFSTCDFGLEYVPHLTVGKVNSIEELNNAYESLKNKECKFECIVYKISVEMIGNNEESIIIFEKNLFHK